MISKLAKAQESWIFKVIFMAVAISFISLFGVSGYISGATQNQTVVNVNGLKTSQSAFSYRLNKEISAIKSIAGEDFDLTDEMRNTIAQNVLDQIVDEGVIDQTMIKNKIYFPKAFIQQVLFSRPEFQNPENGQFDANLFRRYLSASGMSENDYVDMIKRMMARKLMINDLIYPFNVPNTLSKAVHQMDNQRKSFKYITLSPKDIEIERSITDDEIAQYFSDFSERFMINESRDAEVLYIPNDVILNKFVYSDELLKEYFAQHKSELDQPEKRDVLQMVFLNKELAQNAFDKVSNSEEFASVAKELGAENKESATLGVVSYDELAEGLADDVFAMNLGDVKILEVADTWQVVKVQEILPAKEASFEESKETIKNVIGEENLYDAIRDVRAFVDDETNAGKTLKHIANNFGLDTIYVSNIEEDKAVENAPAEIANIVSSLDFNSMVYSYSLNEISSLEEFDDGVIVVEIKKIVDARLPNIEDVKDEIIAIWTVQEKNAIAKEIAENIVIDIEEGTDIVDAAKARNLETFRSEPISRNETFAGLSKFDINDLFLADYKTVKLYEKSGNNYVIAILAQTTNFTDELQENDLLSIQERTKETIASDMARSMLDSYAETLKIDIDYRRAGFSE
ncbi:MAG: peptidylprolyl isomerase [Alphaproteobacteria bacterium]|nr:peptidylprolyl isomerase [Alphaproteobacteria bacterium]